jgi:predicted DNA-binding transcriptional regulator AlpA
MSNNETLMSLREVADFVGVNERTIARWSNAGRFPSPLRLGPRILRWRAGDIQAALAALAGE